MPGMYPKGEYDLAGFAVGAVDRRNVLPQNVRVGDVILGLSSSGVHSNGFSLVRLLVKNSGLNYSAEAPFEKGVSLGNALLRPTKIYVKSCLAAVRVGGLKALAHITGGGLKENVPRVIPNGIAAEINVQSWPLPPVFEWLIHVGNLQPAESVRTFNLGIGMVLIVDPALVEDIIDVLTNFGETVFVIGKTVAHEGEPIVLFKGLESLSR